MNGTRCYLFFGVRKQYIDFLNKKQYMDLNMQLTIDNRLIQVIRDLDSLNM